MTREDMIVLLSGFLHYDEDNWGFVGLSDEEIQAEYDNVDHFDDSEDSLDNWHSYLVDRLEVYPEISFYINLCCGFLDEFRK